MKVLIMIPYFFPGFKSGGPQQTICNVIDVFGDLAEFYIYTQNHDLGSTTEYNEIETNTWIPFKNARVMYVSSKEYCGEQLETIYREFDCIYSCGLFERNTIALLRIHKKYNLKKQVYVAPMGVFSEGAMKIKHRKKKIFFAYCKLFGFFQNIIWSFTSEIEHLDAICWIGEKEIHNYIIAEDLPRKINFESQLADLQTYKKKINTINIVFLSRICEMKNLSYALDVLSNIYVNEIVFDIYGTKEDPSYWEKCENRLNNLPNNICARYCGEVKPNKVIDIFSKYDLFLFPTKGENYGHVIYEALASGCVPVISDKTPWTDFDKSNCGSIISLSDLEGFKDAITKYAEMTGEEMSQYKANAILYAKTKYMFAVNESGYLRLIC